MRSIELHVINTASDVDTVIKNGLAEPEELDLAECAACSDEVGQVDGLFHAFALLLDERDEPWFACYACLEDVIDPQPLTDSTLSYLDDDGEEFEQFTLRDDE
jgi:hypothetical protein